MIICLLIYGDRLAANIYGLLGVARRLVTFFVLPKKVTKKSRPQSVTSSRFPALLGGGRGEIMKRTSDKFNFVIPAQAGIQQDKNAFYLNPLDSRLRGNDEPLEGLCNG